ncbi:cardiolipin synthase [Bradyrhizobium jicamae]|uniref:Cardiolipin synthase n=1 Tax=Bradyrhizobium jicamae TaxID=280332 RepID=A0ABS5FE94_9BRAD|nr:cardiolipin synthase [Bradyrhizobium jicamae]MBR0795057.1 cardiolipin synthase [Bradyrhizobium jicamae]MBR0936931.1 cardiolipin synthase [Bradyrhizobium jicamae]
MGFVQIVLHWFAWVFFLSEWTIRLVMLAVVPFRRSPAAAKGWLLLIFFEPWIGLLLYVLIGRPTMSRWRVQQMARLPQAMAKVRERVLNHPNVFRPEVMPGLEWTGYLAERLGYMPSLGGNDAEILIDYNAILARLAAEIDHAKNHVHLLYFLFAADTATAPVIAALGRAVERGVACRVLVDSVGSRAALPILIPKLTALGVNVREMLPVSLFGHKRARLDLRNHRKIAIVDGRAAFTGSQNLVASDFVAGVTYEELVLRLTGPAVLELQYIFAADWFLETDEVLESEDIFPDAEITGSVPIQVVPSGPDFPTQNNQRLIVALIYAARKQIKITTPYFIPDEPVLQALETAVLRGVDVHLVFSEIGYQPVVSYAQRSYYEELLEAGARVHLYRKNFLHAKFLTIDDTIGLVGTSNMDIRSFALNAEHILVIHDLDMTGRLKSEQQRYIRNCRSLELQQWRKRPFRSKLAEHLARLFSPLL